MPILDELLRELQQRFDEAPPLPSSGEVAEAALAHTVSNKVEAAYRRTNYLDKRRELMREWSDFCMGG